MDIFVYLCCLADTTLLLFLTVYFVITLSDLECDYINAPTCCNKLNKWVLVETIGHLSMSALLLLTLHLYLFPLSLPMTLWLMYKYFTIPSGNIGLFDPAEIHNRQLLKSHMRHAMMKLGYHLIFFFIYLYSMIIALLA